MKLDVEDTIAAIASAPGPALRGVIRLSGPNSLNSLEQLVQNGTIVFDRSTCDALDSSRCATYPAAFQWDALTSVDVLILVWPGQQSFTRQPSIEIHSVGAAPIQQKILQAFFNAGARPAEPGEFTLRAFLSGRLDLTQAEAVLGLIDAKNQRQFETALKQIAGGIGGPIAEVRDELISVLAELEAGLDFVEEDIEFVSNEMVVSSLQKSSDRIQQAVEQLQDRKSSSEILTVVLAGRPNAGKSSLFNLLAGQAAIVSNQPGTTRDYLQSELAIGDKKFCLIDTAGLEEIERGSGSKQIAEQMLLQSESQIANADVLLLCVDASHELNQQEIQILEEYRESTILTATKIDRIDEVCFAKEQLADRMVRTSSSAKIGIELLLAEIQEMSDRIGDSDSTENAMTTRIEHSLLKVQESICLALDAAEQGSGEEIVAAEIHGGLEHLGMIVGTVYTDDILDLVFSRFCIGK